MVVLEPAHIEALDKAFRTVDSSARANAAHNALIAIRRAHSGASPEALLAGILRALAERNQWGEYYIHYQPDTVPITLHTVGLVDFPRVVDVVLKLPQPSDSEEFKHRLMTFMREFARRLTPPNNKTVTRRIVELVNADAPWEQFVGLAVAAPLLGEVLPTLGGDDEQLFRFAQRLHRAWLNAPFRNMFVPDANFAQELRKDIARAVSAWHAPSARYFAPLLRLPASDDPNYATGDDYPAVPFIYLANPTDGLMTQQLVNTKSTTLVDWLDEYGLEELALSPDYDRDALDAVGEAFRNDPKNIERVLTESISLREKPQVCALLVPPLAARFPDTARERHQEYLQKMEQSIRAATTTPPWNLSADETDYTDRLEYAAWVGRYTPALRPMIRSSFLDTLEWLVDEYAKQNDDAQKFALMASQVAKQFANLDANNLYTHGIWHPDFGTEPMAYTIAVAGHWLALRDPDRLLGLPNEDVRRAAMFQDIMRHQRFKKAVCGD